LVGASIFDPTNREPVNLIRAGPHRPPRAGNSDLEAGRGITGLGGMHYIHVPLLPSMGYLGAALKTLLIVFHSLTGATRQMAEAAATGAAGEPDIAVRLLTAPDAEPEDVLGADAYIFATPENLAAIAGRMKDFFDRTYYPALERINGRPYASLICAGSDGWNAARQIARIATGWRLRAVAEPLIVCTRAQTPQAILAPKVVPAADLDRCRDTGAAMAAGLATGIF
jgi:flavodoxin